MHVAVVLHFFFTGAAWNKNASGESRLVLFSLPHWWWVLLGLIVVVLSLQQCPLFKLVLLGILWFGICSFELAATVVLDSVGIFWSDWFCWAYCVGTICIWIILASGCLVVVLAFQAIGFCTLEKAWNSPHPRKHWRMLGGTLFRDL